jgi:hypothetical protein
VILAEVSAPVLSGEGQAVGALKRNEKRKKWIRKMEQRGPQTTQRSRSWSLAAPATLPNEQAVAAFPCTQHILARIASRGPMLAFIQIVNLRGGSCF